MKGPLTALPDRRSIYGDSRSIDWRKQAGPRMELAREADGAELICDVSVVRLGMQEK